MNSIQTLERPAWTGEINSPLLSLQDPARPARVLMVSPGYFPKLGGVENHVYQVSRRLAAWGADITVLTVDTSRKLPAAEQQEGVKIRRAPAYPQGRDYLFAPQLYPEIQQGNWDLVHVQCYHTLVPPLAMLAARRAGLPYLLTFHGGGHSSRLRNSLRSLQHRLLRPLLMGADRLVAVARFEIDLFGTRLGIPKEKFIFISNGTDLPAAEPCNSSQPRGVRIASIGRLERYKGHQRILAALPVILKELPEARLWIAGSGPYEAELRKMAQKLGVAERVEIRAVPPFDRKGMASELSKVSLAVLLSEYETYPVAVLEAVSLGCPALVADTSGFKELAECGLVRTVSLTSTPEEVAQAAVQQLRHPAEPLHLQLPTWDECAAGHLSLYQDILVRRQACAS